MSSCSLKTRVKDGGGGWLGDEKNEEVMMMRHCAIPGLRIEAKGTRQSTCLYLHGMWVASTSMLTFGGPKRRYSLFNRINTFWRKQRSIGIHPIEDFWRRLP